MNSIQKRCGFVIMSCACLVGCGTERLGSTTSTESPTVVVTPSETQEYPAPGMPATDWDRVLVGGIESSTKNAKSDGRLTFDPLLSPDLEPNRVEVTDPALVTDDKARGVALYYETASSEKVVVVETSHSSTDPELKAIAEGRDDPEAYTVIDLHGTQALLIQGGGVGRLRLYVGDVTLDATGPDIKPQDIEDFVGAMLR